MRKFTVEDLRGDETAPESHSIQAQTPEAAATLALGLDVVRGSSKSAKPVAKVFWQDVHGNTNMVRLYMRLHAPRPKVKSPAWSDSQY